MGQLRRAGHSHWAVEGLLASGYNADTFKARFASTVKNHIFTKEFKNPNADTQDVICDFIEAHHKKNGESFISYLYTWGLRAQQNHPRIRAWIQLCRDHHFILYTDGNGKSYTDETERINKFAAQLCKDDANLSELRKKALGLGDDTSTVTSSDDDNEPSVHIYTLTNNTYENIIETYISITLPTEFPTLHGFWPDDEFDGPWSDDTSDGLESPRIDEPWDYS
jgi:hypothetical protein